MRHGWLIGLLVGLGLGCDKPAPTFVGVGAEDSRVKDWGFPRDGCVLELGCAFKPVHVPECTAEAEPSGAFDAGKGTVRGILGLSGMLSTLQGCGDEMPCCNRASARLVVSGPDGPVGLDGHKSPAFECVGDVSALCCPFDGIGTEVIAIGTLVKDPVWGTQLIKPRLCRVRPE